MRSALSALLVAPPSLAVPTPSATVLQEPTGPSTC